MRSKIWAAVATTAILGLSAGPAAAALFVSGDSNIFALAAMGDSTANKAFLTNIAGGQNILVRDSDTPFLTGVSEEVTDYLNGAGYNATLLASNAAITVGDLAGVDLFISAVPSQAFSAAETSALAAFLGSGGNVLLAGDNSFDLFDETNLNVNNLLAGLGSQMRIADEFVEAGFFTANVLAANSYTANTTGFRYAATSAVTGGTGLYGSQRGFTFLAYEPTGAGGVPEPATWALMIGGFGMAGSTLRRRRAATC